MDLSLAYVDRPDRVTVGLSLLGRSSQQSVQVRGRLRSSMGTSSRVAFTKIHRERRLVNKGRFNPRFRCWRRFDG